ncbi:MAG: hypothetical protein HY908_36330 [Myxococcales bacterium]|nr:hypothetical protein [Myxococcales bacterium]
MAVPRALLLVVLAGCGDAAYVIPEEDGVRIVRAELAAHGVSATEARSLAVTVDGVALGVVLDGWSGARALGFEYVSEGDPDLAGAATDLGLAAETPKLQAAVDAALAAEPASHVLVLGTAAHETAELAEGQLGDRVRAWLVALGL